jgi:pyruvate dehydrogenase E1 component
MDSNGSSGVLDSAADMEHVRNDIDSVETREWLDSLDSVLQTSGIDRVEYLLTQLRLKAHTSGVNIPFTANTPYINTIPPGKQPAYPGDRDLERKIKSIIRWNAMAMVVKANEFDGTLGGHISTFASCATLYEVGFNHFFRGPDAPGGGDMIYFQGHASPGMYSRAFVEGRLTEENLNNFRRELAKGGGLSSYPHPWLMPNFWQFPTVSMGLGPIMSIYQARFNRYLQHRSIVETSNRKVWSFLGDGECDEPETLGAIHLASREKLDNLIFVINCNLQRLDGPVRGNGKIIQELEAVFKGAGWNVIKVIWGSEWDPIIARDRSGILLHRMNETVDGEYQKYAVEDGAYLREHFFGKYPELRKLVDDYSDEELTKLRRGGHDPLKVYSAYKAAVENKGSPTVILVKTVKGYGLGEAGEGMNITHQQKKLKAKHLQEFKTRFSLPFSDEEVSKAKFFLPEKDSPESKYLHERRTALGGYLPSRRANAPGLKGPGEDFIQRYSKGSGDKAPSTTGVFVDMLGQLLKDKNIGRHIVPIIPDEGRTFGMDPFFTTFKIYSSVGQLYEPVDAKMAVAYREAIDGQILEEGINEAGSMCSLIAAGTSYSTHSTQMIPFYIYYSMFGFQRIGDLAWAAGDLRARGFMLGATSGRTTLNGEGLQHEDGHSLLVASTIPNLVSYDPAFAFELAIILRDGIRRMTELQEDIFYYITLYNDNYPMHPMPENANEGVLKGLYKLKSSPLEGDQPKAQIFGSGPILMHALKAQQILAEQFGVSADVWSATSYRELRREALDVERWNLLHPTATPRKSYIETVLENEKGAFIAASDNIRSVPEMISRWVPGGMFPLGTDGFGRSETRPTLRRHFEVDAECITLATLYQLSRKGQIQPGVVGEAISKLGIDPEKINPMTA